MYESQTLGCRVGPSDDAIASGWRASQRWAVIVLIQCRHHHTLKWWASCNPTGLCFIKEEQRPGISFALMRPWLDVSSVSFPHMFICSVTIHRKQNPKQTRWTRNHFVSEWLHLQFVYPHWQECQNWRVDSDARMRLWQFTCSTQTLIAHLFVMGTKNQPITLSHRIACPLVFI